MRSSLAALKEADVTPNAQLLLRVLKRIHLLFHRRALAHSALLRHQRGGLHPSELALGALETGDLVLALRLARFEFGVDPIALFLDVIKVLVRRQLRLVLVIVDGLGVLVLLRNRGNLRHQGRVRFEFGV